MHSQEDRAIRQLWGLEAPAVHGPKARWSTAQLAGAAIELAQEGGLDRVSLARVARQLGMTTTAIYRYVGSKAELVDLMVDAAIGDPPEIPGQDWRERCRAWVELLTERYAEHPWLTEVKPKRMPCQPRVYAWIDALVDAVEGEAQVDPLRLALLLDGVIRTYATLEFNLDDTEPTTWLGRAVAERFPRLAAAPQQDVSDARLELTFAVDAILRGLD